MSRGVFVGYAGVVGVLSLDMRGATRDTQGSISGFPSTSNVSREDKRQNHEGNEYSRFRRQLRVCKADKEANDRGNVEIPVLSAMNTRNDLSSESQAGSTRRGFAAMFNSSRTWQDAKAGGIAGSMLQEMSNARSVFGMVKRADDKNIGIWLGVDEPDSNKCVTPKGTIP